MVKEYFADKEEKGFVALKGVYFVVRAWSLDFRPDDVDGFPDDVDVVPDDVI